MPLLTILKREPEVRRLFGRRELAIIEKQLLGVRLTQSERNRLSRDIRKKLEAVRALAPFQDEFGLKRSAEVKRLIKSILKAVKASPQFHRVSRIVLFGSAARNDLTQRSDVDVAVEFDRITLREATKFRIGVLGQVSERADVQVYNTLPPAIRREIDSAGKTLYERPRPR